MTARLLSSRRNLHEFGHEAAAGAMLRQHFPQLFVTSSHEILREFREYERTSTTVLNAYVGPRVSRYLGRFESFAQQLHGGDAYRWPIDQGDYGGIAAPV